MLFSTKLDQARATRAARRSDRIQREQLIVELSAYTTPAERLEIELLAQHSDDPAAAEVLEILNRLPVPSYSRVA